MNKIIIKMQKMINSYYVFNNQLFMLLNKETILTSLSYDSLFEEKFMQFTNYYTNNIIELSYFNNLVNKLITSYYMHEKLINQLININKIELLITKYDELFKNITNLKKELDAYSILESLNSLINTFIETFLIKELDLINLVKNIEKIIYCY